MCTDMCTWGRETRPAGAPDGGRIGACVLTCVLVGGALKDYLAPDGGYIGACVLTCALVGGILRDSLAPDGGYIGACVLTCVPVGGSSGTLWLQMADILGHVY